MKAPRGGPEQLPIEYHKQYKRFNQVVKVPGGQASFTLTADIHYNYKVSGGSPPNTVMCETLKSVTARVNEKLGANFNTILMNVYKDGEDCIGYHRDRETGWAEGTGFATLCFGAHLRRAYPFRITTTASLDAWTTPNAICGTWRLKVSIQSVLQEAGHGIHEKYFSAKTLYRLYWLYGCQILRAPNEFCNCAS